VRPDTKKKKKEFFLCVFEFSLAHDDDYIPPPPHPKNGRWSGRECTGVIVQCKVYIRYMAAGQFLFQNIADSS
jgi:hypothetical protein